MIKLSGWVKVTLCPSSLEVLRPRKLGLVSSGGGERVKGMDVKKRKKK